MTERLETSRLNKRKMSKYGTFQSLLPKLHSSSIPGVFGREIIMKLKKLLMDSIYNGFQGFQLYYQPNFGQIAESFMEQRPWHGFPVMN